MGQAAATQCVNVVLAVALAESQLRESGVDVRNPLATNGADLPFADDLPLQSHNDEDDDFVGWSPQHSWCTTLTCASWVGIDPFGRKAAGQA